MGMWQNRNKKIFGNKKRARSSLKMGRVKGELKVSAGLGSEGTVIPVKIILTDFRPSGVELFSKQDLELHREVSLTIDTQKKKFFAKGSVVARQEIQSDTNLIQNDRFKFRIGVRFQFDSKEQEEEAKQFAHDVNNAHAGGRVEPKADSSKVDAAKTEAPKTDTTPATDATTKDEKKAA